MVDLGREDMKQSLEGQVGRGQTVECFNDQGSLASCYSYGQQVEALGRGQVDV